MKQPAVYIMASKRNGTLYTGVTSALIQRAWQHREGIADGFTKRYGCKLLVWCELADTMEGAILREKQIKAGSRAKACFDRNNECPIGATCLMKFPLEDRAGWIASLRSQ